MSQSSMVLFKHGFGFLVKEEEKQEVGGHLF